MALTRDAIVWGFRLILGRDPESDEGIASHMALADEAALVETLLNSQEFRLSGRFARSLQLREPASAPTAAPWPHESRSSLRLVIFGNCQAAGMGRLVQAMTGDAAVQTYETTPGFLHRVRSGEFDLETAVAGADLVWVQMVAELSQAITKRMPKLAGKMRQLPPLNYAGYHPDCVYVANAAGGYLQGAMGEYQSSLALWGWHAGLHVDQTVELFSDEVFSHLGFHNYHLAAERVLVEHGRRAGMAMAPLLDRWRARGCFMHTVNHPKIGALADMVAVALRREGIDPMEEAADWVEDGLARWPVWPIYPAVARTSGIEAGSFLYKIDRGHCPEAKPVLTMNLPDFVSASYATFNRAGKGNLLCERVNSEAYEGLTRFVRERRGGLTRLAGAIGKHLSPIMGRTGKRADGKSTANPYAELPDHHFWRRSVAKVPASELDPVVRTSFKLDRSTRVATAGSCFAQHIARTLQHANFNYFVVDETPGMALEERKRRGFGVYSARYGNIYTARQLVQLFDRAHGDFHPLDRAWKREDGRYVDPFRPQVEPDGFANAKLTAAATTRHLNQVRRMFSELEVFVFTLGLTEGWRRRADGAMFPLAPGVAAGGFDAEQYEFVNFSANDVLADLRGFVRRLRSVNARAQLIITVSPVPLIATYEDRHVLTSTVYSKSVLRAAAGTFASETEGVDYFPSYEIVTGTPSRGAYFEPDLRSVTEEGVGHVMRVFLRHYAGIERLSRDEVQPATEPPRPASPIVPAAASPALAAIEREQWALDNIVCDEEAIERHRG